jgi:UDP-glucose 4-epimerase
MSPTTTKKILITGGAGFIGSHLARRLLADGHEIYALDDLSTGVLYNVHDLLDNPNFHLVVDSVLTRSAVNELVYKCDEVYHMAAAVGVRLIVERPVHTLVTNLEGTEVVLDACAKFEKPVLVASTSEVYGDHRSATPLNEESRRIYGPTTVKRWAYADSKAMDEFLALAYAQEKGLQPVIVRLFNTVGPRQTGRYGMVVPSFVKAALLGEEVDIHGDGEQTRCFCHVADVIRGLVELMDAGIYAEVFNLGNAVNRISIIDLYKKIAATVGAEEKYRFLPYDEVYGEGIEDMQHRVPDATKIQKAIGWQPELSLNRIIDDVVANFRAEGIGSEVPERDANDVRILTGSTVTA